MRDVRDFPQRPRPRTLLDLPTVSLSGTGIMPSTVGPLAVPWVVLARMSLRGITAPHLFAEDDRCFVTGLSAGEVRVTVVGAAYRI